MLNEESDLSCDQNFLLIRYNSIFDSSAVPIRPLYTIIFNMIYNKSTISPQMNLDVNVRECTLYEYSDIAWTVTSNIHWKLTLLVSQ